MATTQLDKEQKEPAYRRFVPDQVLTASQLNDVIDHFECQDRFTRICLDGVGIACGLEVKYNTNQSIKVSKGCAVTSDGDLIPFSGATYTFAKTFDDVDAKYDRFNGVNLLQLLTDDAAENQANASRLNQVAQLDTMVVVLYLEYFSKEETPCTSTNCDTQGEGQSAKVRLLLISKDDAKRIGNKDNDPIFDAHNNTKKFLDLPDVNLRKIVLKNSYITTANGAKTISENSNTASYFRLKDSYRKAILGSSVIADLKSGMSELFANFRVLLDTTSIATNANSLNTKITSLFTLSSRDLPLDIQYRYDLLKDLVATYNEIKCLLFDLRVVCFPDISSFPKHLFLAELDPTEAFLQCRHSFYPSAIIPHGKEKFEKIRMLILRIHFMLNEYEIPQVSSPIKVTPSKTSRHELGERALPYYFETSPNLIKTWDYGKTKKFKATENLGYQNANLSQSDVVQNPLDYDLDTHDFYRIEGHLGKDYRTAIRELDVIKTNKGLAFDIKVLSIDETIDDIDINDYECEFEDLNAVLKAWRAEQNCLNAGISRFFSGFSLKNEGKHKFYKLSNLASATTSATAVSTNTPTEVSTSSSRSSASISSLGNLSAGTASNFTAANTNFLFSGASNPILASGIGLLSQPLVNANFGLANFNLANNFLNPIYNINTVILENLETDDDVLGSIVDKAMREKPDGSAEDIVALVKSRIDADPEIANWDTNTKKVAIYNASEILSYTKIASRFIPNDISEINTERITNYDKTIRDLCSRAERFKKNMTSLLYQPETTYSRVGHEQQYELLLNQISVNCCSAAKMKSLLTEIETRKKKILEQKLLSKFVEKHSGLEHKAGVQPGHTFVLVYKGGKRAFTPFNPINVFQPNLNVLSNLVNTNFGLRDNLPLANISTLRTSESKAKTKPSTTREVNFAGLNPSFANSNAINPGFNLDFINPNILNVLGDGFIRPPISNIAENTVIADFTLPYICCSDCSPIAFIVPKTPISLRLPLEFVCLEEELPRLAFEVSPSDGVITADIDEGINGGVVQVDDRYFFDATQVSEELYGQDIEFTVNGQFTDCKISVFKKPEFDFEASETRFAKNNAIASVIFTVEGDNLPDGVSYEWDFGDEDISENNTVENPRHEYRLNLGDDGTQTFGVSLTVTNGRCSHTVTHDIVIAPVILSLTIADEVCLLGTENSDTLVPFEVTPDDAEVAIAVPISRLQISDRNLVFQAGFSAFNNSIRFTVNGQSVPDKCMPRISPQVLIVLPSEDRLVINAASDRITVQFGIENLNGFDENAVSYRWTFGDNDTSSQKTPLHTYRAPRDAGNGAVLNFNVSLVISGSACDQQTFTDTVRIRVERII